MNEHEHSQCKHLLGSLSEYIDGALEAELCAELEEHLKGCENCRVVVNTLRKTIEIYHETSPISELSPQVQQRLFLTLDLDEFIKKDKNGA